MYRLVVTKKPCEPRCYSCIVCDVDSRTLSLAGALAETSSHANISIAGGDSLNWKFLFEYINDKENKNKIFTIETPVHHINNGILKKLFGSNIQKIILQTTAVGEKLEKFLQAGNLDTAIKMIQQFDMQVEIRLMVSPKTFSIIVPLAVKFRQIKVWLEINRERNQISQVQLEKSLRSNYNLFFTGHRIVTKGYLPPCLLRTQWNAKPETWRSVLREIPSHHKNSTFLQCNECAINRLCQFQDENAVIYKISKPQPIASKNFPWKQKIMYLASSSTFSLAKSAPKKVDILCTKPWTTFQVSDLDGIAHQCCTTWTYGGRGDIYQNSISEIWHGDGFITARRLMITGQHKKLCKNICPRVYDKKFSLSSFRIIEGSKVFVENQQLMLREMLNGISEIKSKPLFISLCPSTYCNYDCIMCIHGRTPTRTLPDHIWDEITEFLPTLHNLTLLGGEPLANKKVINFLQQVDSSLYPDLHIDLITNGSLLNQATLRKLNKCHFSSLTISVNAGSPLVYEKVMRGLQFAELLENLSQVQAYRSKQDKWFDITLSFVVQPANSEDVINFIKLAQDFNVNIRLIPLSPESVPELNFYNDSNLHGKVLQDLETAKQYITVFAPKWISEVESVLQAIKNSDYDEGNNIE